MNRLNYLKSGILIIISVMFFGSCEGIIDPPSIQDIDGTIRAMDDFDQPIEKFSPYVEGPIESGDPNYPERPEDFNDEDIEETEAYLVNAAPGYDQLLVLNPASDVIWLGSILDGNTIPSGVYKPITTNRSGLTFSIISSMGVKSRTVTTANLSNIREATTSIITSDLLMDSPVYVDFDTQFVYSEEQLNLAMGANYSDWGLDVSSGFDFSNKQTKTRMLVRFMQMYYTLDINYVQDPSDLFVSGTRWNDLRYQIDGNTSPVIISSIKYGRMALFTVESDYSEEVVKAALEAANDEGLDGGEGSFTADHQEVLLNSSIKGFVCGGSGSSVGDITFGNKGATDVDAFLNWVKEDGELAGLPSAVPLSYTMRYLKDWSIARVVLETEYWKRKAIYTEEPPVSNAMIFEDVSILNSLIDIGMVYGDPSLVPNFYATVTIQKGYDGYGIVQTLGSATSSDSSEDFGKTVSPLNFTAVFNEGFPLEDAYVYITIDMWHDADITGVPETEELKIYLAAYSVNEEVEKSVTYEGKKWVTQGTGTVIVSMKTAATE